MGLTGVKHWLVFGDDLRKQGFLPLLAHLRQVLLFDLSLLLGGRVLAGIVVCIHLQKHNKLRVTALHRRFNKLQQESLLTTKPSSSQWGPEGL